VTEAFGRVERVADAERVGVGDAEDRARREEDDEVGRPDAQEPMAGVGPG
jgi:hypothetical protein